MSVARRCPAAALAVLALLAGPACRDGDGGCRGCATPAATEAVPARTPLALRPGEVRLSAPGRAGVALTIRKLDRAGGSLTLDAQGERGAWIHAVHLEQALELSDTRIEAPQAGGLCRVRYLQGGRETEADLALDDVRVRAVDGDAATRVTVDLTGRCVKLFDQTTRGTPYAAPLPEVVQLAARFELER